MGMYNNVDSVNLGLNKRSDMYLENDSLKFLGELIQKFGEIEDIDFDFKDFTYANNEDILNFLEKIKEGDDENDFMAYGKFRSVSLKFGDKLQQPYITDSILLDAYYSCLGM